MRGSTADFGFYTQRAWEKLCPEHGLAVGRSTRVPRFERLWWRPWARSAFVLDKVGDPAAPGAFASSTPHVDGAADRDVE